MHRSQKLLGAVGTALLGGALGCSRGEEAPPAVEAAPPSASVPADRLAPGETKPGAATAFGLTFPYGMRVIARFPDAVHLRGRIPADQLHDYLRARITVGHVEMAGARVVYPAVRIKNGDAARVYDIEVTPLGALTKVSVRDVTRPAAPEGLTEEERWRRAGYTPDGRLIDPNSLY